MIVDCIVGNALLRNYRLLNEIPSARYEITSYELLVCKIFRNPQNNAGYGCSSWLSTRTMMPVTYF